jgi:hypothetical protein
MAPQGTWTAVKEVAEAKVLGPMAGGLADSITMRLMGAEEWKALSPMEAIDEGK